AVLLSCPHEIDPPTDAAAAGARPPDRRGAARAGARRERAAAPPARAGVVLPALPDRAAAGRRDCRLPRHGLLAQWDAAGAAAARGAGVQPERRGSRSLLPGAL